MCIFSNDVSLDIASSLMKPCKFIKMNNARAECMCSTCRSNRFAHLICKFSTFSCCCHRHYGVLASIGNWRFDNGNVNDNATNQWFDLTTRQQDLTTATSMTTPQINDLIGWMKKNNRAARAALFLVHCFVVVCQTTTWNFHIWGSDDNGSSQ